MHPVAGQAGSALRVQLEMEWELRTMSSIMLIYLTTMCKERHPSTGAIGARVNPQVAVIMLKEAHKEILSLQLTLLLDSL